MLMSSLPKPGPLFLAKQPPLSRLKLDLRLRVLSAEEREMLKLVEDVLHWRRLPMGVSDELVIDRGRAALSCLDNDTLRFLVRDRLEIRTVVAALRRRLRGEPPPPAGLAWGFGRWTGHIARNWGDPAFALEGVFPWLREADRLLRQNDSIALERLLLGEAYKQLTRLESGHTFDFEAVVIYVLKWTIVDRWSAYNGEAATRRFDDLTEAGLADYAALSFDGDAP